VTTLADAFEAFITPHLQRLRLLAGQYARTREDAADLVQETLLRAWRNFSRAQDAAYHRAWLVVIMRNIALDWQQEARRRVRLTPVNQAELTDVASFDASDPFAPMPAMSETDFREFLDQRLVQALEALEPPYREVVVLSVAGALSYREISEVLDCPVGTVMSRMGRARRTLRERLAVIARSEGWVRERQP